MRNGGNRGWYVASVWINGLRRDEFEQIFPDLGSTMHVEGWIAKHDSDSRGNGGVYGVGGSIGTQEEASRVILQQT